MCKNYFFIVRQIKILKVIEFFPLCYNRLKRYYFPSVPLSSTSQSLVVLYIILSFILQNLLLTLQSLSVIFAILSFTSQNLSVTFQNLSFTSRNLSVNHFSSFTHFQSARCKSHRVLLNTYDQILIQFQININCLLITSDKYYLYVHLLVPTLVYLKTKWIRKGYTFR